MNRAADRLSGRVLGVTVGMITLAGFLLRFNLFGDSVFGDELSTLWIVQNHGFTETVSVVHSDAEITPPLYFLLAWLATHLGPEPELVRLPALIAGTLTIPLTYLFGLRTLGRATGIAAALIVAVSPYMTFLSAYGRGYSLMIFFLVASGLAMLAGLRTGRVRWWVAYGLCCCLAMYSHYTAAFVLLAQFLWLVVACPTVRRPAILAAAGAVVLYLPWITGLVDDLNSPTQAILEFLQGKGLTEKARSIAQSVAGEPMVGLSRAPGRLAMVLVAAGLLTGALASGLRLWQERDRADRREQRKMFALVLLTAAATLLAELVLLGLGTDLLSDRNLSASWAGLPVLAGALFTIPRFRIGMVAALATVGGLFTSAVRVSDRTVSGSAYKKAAGFIEDQAGPGDVVLDFSHYTPAPLTQIDAYLPSGHREFRPGLPIGPPPFLPVRSRVEPVDRTIARAFAAAGSHRVFVVARRVASGDSDLISGSATPVHLPPDWKPIRTRSWPGFVPVTVTVLAPVAGGSGRTATKAEGEDQPDHGQPQKEGGDLGAGDR